jgi:hypothetical protein
MSAVSSNSQELHLRQDQTMEIQTSHAVTAIAADGRFRAARIEFWECRPPYLYAGSREKIPFNMVVPAY